LTEADVTPEAEACIRKIVGQYIRYQGKSRFINKNTRNSRRIRFLNRIFDDALFIHVIRDPRATINSFLEVGFWPDLKIWCCDKITPREWEGQGRDPVILAARLWMKNVQRVLEDRAVLGKDRYIEVRYEDFMARPDDVLAALLDFAGLRWNDRFRSFASTFTLKSMNFKYKARFSEEQLAEIKRVVQPLAGSLGYDW